MSPKEISKRHAYEFQLFVSHKSLSSCQSFYIFLEEAMLSGHNNHLKKCRHTWKSGRIGWEDWPEKVSLSMGFRSEKRGK
jgi:hypothetical protein